MTLEEATLEDLCDEIHSRGSDSILVLSREHKVDYKLTDYFVDYRGGMHTALGLLEYARIVLQTDLQTPDDE